jgi:hypothetical protein
VAAPIAQQRPNNAILPSRWVNPETPPESRGPLSAASHLTPTPPKAAPGPATPYIAQGSPSTTGWPVSSRKVVAAAASARQTCVARAVPARRRLSGWRRGECGARRVAQWRGCACGGTRRGRAGEEREVGHEVKLSVTKETDWWVGRWHRDNDDRVQRLLLPIGIYVIALLRFARQRSPTRAARRPRQSAC